MWEVHKWVRGLWVETENTEDMMIDRGHRPQTQWARTKTEAKHLAYSMSQSKNNVNKYRLYHREVRLNGPYVADSARL